MKRKVCILILNWNNWQDTLECLESVYQNAYPDYQVFVVDNASTDGSIDKIIEWAEGKLQTNGTFVPYRAENKPIPYRIYDRSATRHNGDTKEKRYPVFSSPLILIQTGANLGYAGGNNVGLRLVLEQRDFSHVWILNNDTIIHQEALKELVSCAEGNNGIAAAGSKLLSYRQPDVLQLAGGCRIVPWMGNAAMIGMGEKDDGKWNKPLEPDYISGASLLVKKKVIEDVGLMDERYFLYWEDADWGERMRRKGYRLLYCPASRIWHKEGSSAGRLSPSSDYYWVRNGLYFMKKFYPSLLPLTPFSYLMKFTLIRLVKRQPLHFSAFLKGVKDFLKKKAGPLDADDLLEL